MLKHIVFIKLKNTFSKIEKTELIGKIDSMLNDLPNSIDVIQHLETGINISTRPSAFDLSLCVDLNDFEDLEEYRIHPKHKLVLEFLAQLNIETAVVDYIK